MIQTIVNIFKFLFTKQPVKPSEMTVLSVSDGDTIKAKSTAGETITLRLFGIDTPETPKSWLNQPGQPFGKEAREFLYKQLNPGMDIFVFPEAKDQYGRIVASIYKKADPTEPSVNEVILASGLAWYDTYGDKNNPDHPRRQGLREAAKNAQNQKIGIWSLDSVESPHEYRKRMKR